MEFAEAKNELVRVKTELAEFESEYKELYKQYGEIGKKMRSCESKKKNLTREIKKLQDIIESEDIYANVLWIEGFEMISQVELVAISTGMDQTNYRDMELVRISNNKNIPRYIDLERLVKEVIEFKKQYPGWILERIQKTGQYDTLPPQSFYKFTYKSPHGHYMSYGGIEIY